MVVDVLARKWKIPSHVLAMIICAGCISTSTQSTSKVHSESGENVTTHADVGEIANTVKITEVRFVIYKQGDLPHEDRTGSVSVKDPQECERIYSALRKAKEAMGDLSVERPEPLSQILCLDSSGNIVLGAATDGGSEYGTEVKQFFDKYSKRARFVREPR